MGQLRRSILTPMRSCLHWWYETVSHAAELTAGFNNSCHRDGYAAIAHEAMADPEGLVWQVLNSAWDTGIHVASENALPCYDRDGNNKILENLKPRNDPDGNIIWLLSLI